MCMVVKSFTKLFIQMQLHALAHSVGIEESYPRIASYQLHRSNTPAANASQYYQRTLTIPMLDHLITELDNRFEEGTAGIIGELEQILPSELVSFFFLRKRT